MDQTRQTTHEFRFRAYNSKWTGNKGRQSSNFILSYAISNELSISYFYRKFIFELFFGFPFLGVNLLEPYDSKLSFVLWVESNLLA